MDNKIGDKEWSAYMEVIRAYRKTCEYFSLEFTWEGMLAFLKTRIVA